MQPEIYWIPSPWKGCLAVLPRPRGGDWLEDEINGFRKAGVDVMVSALEKPEEAMLELSEESELCQAKGIEFISFPIPDGTAPTSEKPVGELVRLLETRLAAGKNVAIHCRAGIGRCVTLAACAMALAGIAPEDAFQKMRQARGCHVPDKKEQEEFVKRFAENLTATNNPK
ncbi:MAG TPA: dual specificity protein phosphatase family protein [Gemmataceae bacterium]|jgi:protein-tyrosine phosphatase|nr:dual specificity protein phosphatase family protein [Gemmataceae bacterium]